jgi:hypothetical protein
VKEVLLTKKQKKVFVKEKSLEVCDLIRGREYSRHFDSDVFESPEAVFLVMCDPSMNELWVT